MKKYLMTIEFDARTCDAVEIWSDEITSTDKHVINVSDNTFKSNLYIDENNEYKSYGFAWITYDDNITEEEKQKRQMKVKHAVTALVTDFFNKKIMNIQNSIKTVNEIIHDENNDADLINADSEIYNERYIN